MRIIRSEFAHDYPSYSFGYTLHGKLEEGETPGMAYEAGFLPESADPNVHDRFYMARSIRVPLQQGFAPTSENRRILKKFDGKFEASFLTREELIKSDAFTNCFLSYFADRHGQSVMSPARLAGILETTLPLRGVCYAYDGTPVAYVLEITEKGFAHYWFSCYSMEYASTSLGMWLMLDAVKRAQDEGRAHLYLGTAYGEKGRYKMNICPLQFWDGDTWNDEAASLKRLISNDPKREL